MANFPLITAEPIYFLSDTHFTGQNLPAEAGRQARFFTLLQQLPSGSALYLLGDIFNFYFEYNSAVLKRYFSIFLQLRACRDRGVDLHFLGGNHDCWTRDFFQSELGMVVHKGKIRFTAQGRKVVCAHGDRVLPRDYGYKLLRSIIQNRPVIWTASLLHPDLLNGIANLTARWSARHHRRSHERTARSLAQQMPRLFEEGNDFFIMGHIHYPLLTLEAGREFLILGDWLDHFTYGKLEAGRLSLETFTG
jgi:UDP-2,3-diacylglucosamine hydrolase